MRLFFLIIHFILSSALLSGIAAYIPLSSFDRGEAFLTGDISPESRKASLRFFRLGQGTLAEAGSDWEKECRIPVSEKAHFKGEVVLAAFDGNDSALSSLTYTGQYKRTTDRIRGLILRKLTNLFHSLGKPGALLEALILGKKQGIPYMAELFRQAGVSHLLALSGLHIGLTAAILYCLLGLFLPSLYRGPAVFLLLCFYAWLVGDNPSFLRAVIMFGLAVGLSFAGVKISPAKILLLSALLQALFWQQSLRSWSYRLSYGAMAGLILSGPFWKGLLRRFMPDMLALPLALSLAAQTAVLPMILAAFGWFQPAGIAAGLILTPLITLYLGAGLGAVALLLPFPGLSELFLYPFQGLYLVMERVALIFGRFPRIDGATRGGKLLFFLSLSANMGIILLLIIKEWKFVRKNPQIEL